jgi:hypothetical protein
MKFRDFVVHDYSFAVKKVQDFKDDLRFDNCDDAFHAAAKVSHYVRVFNSFTNAEAKGETEAERAVEILDFLRRERQNKCKWPHRSTSVTSNFYGVCELAAIAEIIELMESWQKEYAQ